MRFEDKETTHNMTLVKFTARKPVFTEEDVVKAFKKYGPEKEKQMNKKETLRFGDMPEPHTYDEFRAAVYKHHGKEVPSKNKAKKP